MTPKERLYNFIEGKPVDRVPNLNILMLFAAKYIDQPYGKFCQDYRVLVEGNVRCNKEFDIDLLSTMSDPYRETADFGAEMVYPEDDLPHCKGSLLQNIEDVKHLQLFDPWKGRRFRDRLQAIELYKEQYGSEYPILGWVEGPIAEACDLRGINEAMLDLMGNPLFDELLDLCTEQAIICAKAQLEAGADIIGIGDAVASIIGPTMYREKVVPREKRIVESIHKAGGLVKLHICGDITPLLEDIIPVQPDILDIDYAVDMDRAVELFRGISVVNGNINPVDILNKSSEEVYRLVRELRDRTQGSCSISAGCEIPKDTPPENLLAFARALQ